MEEPIVQTQAEPPLSAPKDAPVPPETRGRKEETFAEKWARHGGNLDDLGGNKKEAAPAEASPETPEDKPTEPTKAPGAPAEETLEPAAATNAKLAQIKELAKELGLAFDGGRVMSGERQQFREAQRKHKAHIEQQRAEAEREIQEHRQGLAQELETATKLFKARDDGDWNGLAQVLGFEDYNAMQREVATRVSDPNYRRMRELEEWRAKQEQAEQERQQREEQTRIEQEQKKAVDDYMVQLADHMSQSDHRILKALGRQRFFLNAVHAIQRDQFDGSSTVTPEQALTMTAPGSTVPLDQELRSIYGVLHQAYGEEAAAAPTPSPSQITKKDKDAADASTVKSAPVPPSGTTEASAPRKAPTDRREFAKWMQQRLEDEELRERLAQRSIP